MKIGVINSLYRPFSRGGAEIVAEQQVAKYLKQGHEVFVITTKPAQISTLSDALALEKSETQPLTVGQARVYYLRPRFFFSFSEYQSQAWWLRFVWLAWDMVNVWQAGKIRRILLNERPAKVSTHNLRGLSYLVPRLLKWLKIRHHHTLHDIQLAYPSGLLTRSQGVYSETHWLNRWWLRHWYERWCCRLINSPDKVIAPSQWLMDFYVLKGFFKKSKLVVRPPVNISIYKDLSVNLANKRQIKMLYVGQLEEHKGIVFLIQALKKIQLNREIKLTIVGEGRARLKLEEIIGTDSRFALVGFVPHEKISSYYQQADLTVVPSLTYENSPTVIFESLACHRPVLASTIGGIPEFVIPGRTGWLFAPGDADSLTQALELILA